MKRRILLLAGAMAALASFTALAKADGAAGVTTLAFSSNPAVMDGTAATDVTITSTTTSAGHPEKVDEGKIHLFIATDGFGNPVDCEDAVVWIRIDNYVSNSGQVGGDGGLDVVGNQTWVSIDLDNLSSLGVTDLNPLGLGLHDIECGATVAFKAQYVTGGGQHRVSTHDSACYDLETQCPCRPVTAEDAETRSKGFYGNNNGEIFLNANLPGGIVVGTGFTMTFTSGATLFAYFDAGDNGTPAALSGSHVDPLSTESQTFGLQVAALKVNLVFDALFGNGDLGDIEFRDSSSAFDGMTISEILAAAEVALGGGALLGGTTIDGIGNNSYNAIVNELNLAFDNGGLSGWASQYLWICD